MTINYDSFIQPLLIDIWTKVWFLILISYSAVTKSTIYHCSLAKDASLMIVIKYFKDFESRICTKWDFEEYVKCIIQKSLKKIYYSIMYLSLFVNMSKLHFKFVSMPSVSRLPLYQALFTSFRRCYTERQVPVLLPGVMMKGQAQVQVTLHHHVCVQLCASVAALPPVYIPVLVRSTHITTCTLPHALYHKQQQ